MYIKKNYWLKCLLLCCTIGLLILFLIYYAKEDGRRVLGIPVVTEKEVQNLTEGRKRKEEWINISFEGEDIAYDWVSRTYYIYQPLEEDDWIGKFDYNNVSEYQMYFLSDDYFDQKEKAIKDGHAFKCILLSEDTYWEKSIVFSGLPIMKINGLNDNYNRLSDLTFFGYDENGEYNVFSSKSMYHARGAASAMYAKRNYKISLCDKKQNQVKTSFLGMQKDDDWILTGFYTDSTRMRDNLGYKFWDAINEDRQDVVKTASYKFVEVYINNIYRGIYALMEPMNGKHFSLGQGDYLYKVRSWEIPTNDVFNMYEWFPDLYNENGGRTISMKYPKEVQDESVWSPLKSYMEKFYWTDVPDIKSAEELIDIDNIIDYYLFCQVTYATDNLWKNAYIIAKKQDDSSYKLYKTVWDLNYTWGDTMVDDKEALWTVNVAEDKILGSIQDYEVLKKSDSENINSKTKEKWRLWRETFLTTENLIGMINDDMELLKDSGSWKREKEKWPECEVKDGRQDLEKWIDHRLNYLDTYFGTL